MELCVQVKSEGTSPPLAVSVSSCLVWGLPSHCGRELHGPAHGCFCVLPLRTCLFLGTDSLQGSTTAGVRRI